MKGNFHCAIPGCKSDAFNSQPDFQAHRREHEALSYKHQSCKIPGLIFGRPHDLERHVRNKHPTILKYAGCPAPGCKHGVKPTNRLDKYRSHVRSHREGTEFACPVDDCCYKGTLSKALLLQHLSAVHGFDSISDHFVLEAVDVDLDEWPLFTHSTCPLGCQLDTSRFEDLQKTLCVTTFIARCWVTR